VQVHERDAYESLRALLPPAQARRGLVLMDPPFEEPGEFERLAEGLQTIQTRFAPAVVALWYPIKHRTPVHAFENALKDAGTRDVLKAELLMRPPHDPERLNGSGLMVIKPPYGFAQDAQALLTRLGTTLGAYESAVTTLIPE
jgi:23S rRNA (adenine2030-N6)-methyltransferase